MKNITNIKNHMHSSSAPINPVDIAQAEKICQLMDNFEIPIRYKLLNSSSNNLEAGICFFYGLSEDIIETTAQKSDDIILLKSKYMQQNIGAAIPPCYVVNMTDLRDKDIICRMIIQAQNMEFLKKILIEKGYVKNFDDSNPATKKKINDLFISKNENGKEYVDVVNETYLRDMINYYKLAINPYIGFTDVERFEFLAKMNACYKLITTIESEKEALERMEKENGGIGGYNPSKFSFRIGKNYVQHGEYAMSKDEFFSSEDDIITVAVDEEDLEDFENFISLLNKKTGINSFYNIDEEPYSINDYGEDLKNHPEYKDYNCSVVLHNIFIPSFLSKPVSSWICAKQIEKDLCQQYTDVFGRNIHKVNTFGNYGQKYDFKKHIKDLDGSEGYLSFPVPTVIAHDFIEWLEIKGIDYIYDINSVYIDSKSDYCSLVAKDETILKKYEEIFSSLFEKMKKQHIKNEILEKIFFGKNTNEKITNLVNYYINEKNNKTLLDADKTFIASRLKVLGYNLDDFERQISLNDKTNNLIDDSQ